MASKGKGGAPKIRKKVNPFYVQQWWNTLIILLAQATFLSMIIYALLVTTVITIMYALQNLDADESNLPDLIFYLSLVAMKKMIITCSFRAIFSTKKIISLYMTCSFRLIFHLLSMIYELIVNS